MGVSLDPQQQQAYQDDGVLFPLTAVTASEASVACGHALDFLERQGPDARAVDSSQVHLFLPWAFDLVTDSRVLDAVEGVLGPNIIGWATTLFAKPPGDSSRVTWHQDGTYWGLDSTQVTTAWIALTVSDTANGCMRVVPETQQLAIQPHRDTFANDNLLSRGQEIQVEVDEADVVDLVLQPGEMSLHHVNLVHGSEPNTTDGWRVGFTVRYVRPDVRQLGEELPLAVLARGRDDHGNYRLVERPAERPLDEAVEALREFNRGFLSRLMPTSE
ncbi:MAG TPA: phytanoyl-CoA dioxygenase [Planctomycetaceae bacterium]|nr:phytanoyl-CoA dioxygenase [Planctomycetaceae bacterium]|tara:strand:+ start:1965 stop:2783 length:819 start_codon:yes stop_codon:yes gene_type:complete